MDRTRAIGSTCAERMAVDQLFFYNNKKPCLIVLTGLFNRKGWTKDTILYTVRSMLRNIFNIKFFSKTKKSKLFMLELE